jgi:hypothetical protein
MINVYTLKLTSGKYYIGKFTKLYPPIEFLEKYYDIPVSFENELTKKYMRKYGIDNVRGGTYNQVILDDDTIKSLLVEFWTEDDMCLRCGRSSHYIEDCYAITNIEGDYINGSFFRFFHKIL